MIHPLFKTACALFLALMVAGCSLFRPHQPAPAPSLYDDLGYRMENVEGQTATNLVLQTEAGQSYGLHDVEAEHTLLFFYDPACMHCAAISQALYKMFLAYREKDLMVYAVYTGSDKKAWQQWIAEGDYTQWVNVYDAAGGGQVFDAYRLDPAVPTLFLLDRDKTIEVSYLSFNALYHIVSKLL